MSETERPKPEPKPLTPEYHKAHKQLMLWASILLVWSLVGVDLSKAEAMGGTVGAIIAAIKSPQAIPWALVILVGYFLFKVFVEWHQCIESRKAIRVARFDYYSGWIVAFAAYALYFIQTLSRVQFADWITYSHRFRAVFTGVVITIAMRMTYYSLPLRGRSQKYIFRNLSIAFIVMFIMVGGAMIFDTQPVPKWFGAGLGIGVLLQVVIWYLRQATATGKGKGQSSI